MPAAHYATPCHILLILRGKRSKTFNPKRGKNGVFVFLPMPARGRKITVSAMRCAAPARCCPPMRLRTPPRAACRRLRCRPYLPVDVTIDIPCFFPFITRADASFSPCRASRASRRRARPRYYSFSLLFRFIRLSFRCRHSLLFLSPFSISLFIVHFFIIFARLLPTPFSYCLIFHYSDIHFMPLLLLFSYYLMSAVDCYSRLIMPEFLFSSMFISFPFFHFPFPFHYCSSFFSSSSLSITFFFFSFRRLFFNIFHFHYAILHINYTIIYYYIFAIISLFPFHIILSYFIADAS